ncbi:Uncharacterized protein SCF082_LOCUS8446, partial [Durusdinium trenchii]
MVDVEISRSAWKAREGGRVRQYVGQYSRQGDEETAEMIRLLKSASSMTLCADMIGRAVAKYRHVYSNRPERREATAKQMSCIFQQMQENGWGKVEPAENGWPVFRKYELMEMDGAARKKLLEVQVPTFMWQRFPPAARKAGKKTEPKGPSNEADERTQCATPSRTAPLETTAATSKAQTSELAAKLSFATTKLEQRHQEESPQLQREMPPECPVVQMGMMQDASQECVPRTQAAQGRHDARKPQKLSQKQSDKASKEETHPARNASSRTKAVAEEDWETVFEGQVRMEMTYEKLREMMETKLGEQKDPGIYTCKDKSRTTKRIELRANCKETACCNCTKQVKVSLDKSYMPPLVTVHVCVIWTCAGMLLKAQSGQKKVLKLVVDGKQSIVANSYTVANMTHIFEVAKQIGEQYCRLDLALQVVQVHKDYAKGIEASRKKVFRNARRKQDGDSDSEALRGRCIVEHMQATKASLESNIRAAPARIFASMQEIFQEDFAERYAWGSVCDYFTPSGDEAPALYNSQSLRAAGRSPAVDFWNHRERRLCGGHNYYKVHHRTQGEDKDSWEGITTFHIMRAQKLKDVMPAEAVIDKDVANNMVMLMTAQGEKLKQAMSDTGLSTTHSNKTHPLLEVRPLEIFFKFHCAVIEGHLPTTLWSNVHKKLHNDGAKTLCSCHAFSLHGNCEHVIYVKALNNVDDYATKLAE